MSSSAIRSQGTTLRIASAAGSAKPISAITAAAPPVVTSAAHGLANGTVVVITGIVGMIEVNDRAFVVANQATNTFELKGVDGLAYTAYASGGSATPQTMVEIANVRSSNLFEGESGDIEKTNLRSIAKEYDVDLPDPGTGSLTIDVDPTDPGQIKCKTAKDDGIARAFTETLRTGAVAAFMAQVKSFPSSKGVGAHIQGTIGLRITTKEAWYA
jgi:hypothetical protein